jgi:hypothetical protein
MNPIQKILKKEYGVTEEESAIMLKYAKEEIEEGSNPETVIFEYFGLGPEYVIYLV